MSIEFTRELIKGRIAEVVFEQMIRDQGEFTTIPFGYEHTIPTLAQYQHLTEIKRVIENIKDAPDFAIISNDKTKVFLVEVKFRSSINMTELKETAQNLLKRWDPSWIFIATPTGFYFSPTSYIARGEEPSRLTESWISKDRQNKYLTLLNEFERK